MTIATSTGDAVVLHRLALAVECVDATTRRLVTKVLRITRDDSGAVLAEHGPGRGVLVHDQRTPSKLTIRIADPARQFVPRRLTVPLWSVAEVSAADNDGGPFVPAASRLLRPWLLPGSAYPLVRGATGVARPSRSERRGRQMAEDRGNRSRGHRRRVGSRRRTRRVRHDARGAQGAADKAGLLRGHAHRQCAGEPCCAWPGSPCRSGRRAGAAPGRATCADRGGTASAAGPRHTTELPNFASRYARDSSPRNIHHARQRRSFRRMSPIQEDPNA